MGDEAERTPLAGEGGAGPGSARTESPGLGRRLVGFLGMLILAACFCVPAYWAGVIALRAERFGSGQVAMGVVAIGLFGIGSALALWGLYTFRSPSTRDKEPDRLEKRAAALGLPTEAEAYQDRGLAVAATTFTLQEADLICAMLCGKGIPARVDGPLVASWGVWAQQPMDGIHILVPQGRLKDAHALLEKHRRQRGVPEDRAARKSEEANPGL